MSNHRHLNDLFSDSRPGDVPNPIDSLFRPASNVKEAHALVCRLGLAAQDGSITESQCRQQADLLMQQVLQWNQQVLEALGTDAPQAQQVTRTAFAFIMARAETDILFGDPVRVVAKRYGVVHMESLARLQAFEQETQGEVTLFPLSN